MPQLPIIGPWRERIRKEAAKEAATAVAKAFLTGNAATMPSNAAGMMQSASTGGPRMPGTSWSNQGGTSSALIARVTQNLSQSFGMAPAELEVALAEQGLSWGPPFPPGRPLDPFWGYRRAPRTWDYAVGENVQIVPRWDRVSFATLKAIYDAYDVAQICVRHLINDVRSLEYKFVAAPGVDQKAAELDIAKAEAFMALPDRRQPLRLWLAEWLQDVLRYDAGCLYVRRNEAGEPVALEVVDGTTMIPLIDFYGRIAADEHDATDQPEGGETGAVVPAFMQIIEGLPWDWLALDDIIYLPWNPLPNSQYGLSPLEAVLLSANTDLRFQWHFLQYFTEGTLPAGLMEAPPDQSDPDSLREWQETWDAIMLGDQSKLRQIRWVPSGSKFNATKNSDFDDKFPLYLMRRVAAAYGVTPNDLGFTENVNRATGDTQVDVQFRVGVIPLLRYAEDIINLFLREHLKLKAQIHFDDGREIEDRVATAQAHQIYVQAGVESPDEVRSELGLPIDPANPTPRFLAGRTGVVLLSTLEEQAGKTSPETFAPPKPPPPKLMPPPGALTPNDGPPAPGGPPAPPPGQPPKPQGQPEQGSADDADEKTMKALFERIDGLLGELQKDNSGGPGVAGGLGSTGGPLHIGAPDNTGGPGVTRGLANPTTITGGLMVDTDLQGVDLIGAEEDEDEEDDDKDDAAKQALLALTLKRWRENSRRRLNKGLPPRRFADVPEDVASVVWGRLANARSHAEIDEAFKAASGGGGSVPKGRGLTATSKRNW